MSVHSPSDTHLPQPLTDALNYKHTMQSHPEEPWQMRTITVMAAEMTKYLNSWDNLNRFVLGDGDGKPMWSTTKQEGLLHEFPFQMNRVTHGWLCKKTNLVNTISLGKCLDSTIQLYRDFPMCWHSLSTCSWSDIYKVLDAQKIDQQLPTWGCPKGQAHFWENLSSNKYFFSG